MRVALGDNVWYRKGQFEGGDARLVAHGVRMAQEFDRPVTTVADMCEFFGSDSSTAGPAN